MFHLFKKVYLDFDDKISMSSHRIVCSAEHGGIDDLNVLARVFYGRKIANAKTVADLIGPNKQYPTLVSLLETLNNELTENNNNPIYIYCDKAAYFTLAVMWLKRLLVNASSNDAWKFFKSNLFKEQNFTNSRMSATQRGAVLRVDEWLADEAQFVQLWDSTIITNEEKLAYASFLQQINNSVRIEFLLAGYLYDKRNASDLARSMTALVRRDLEEFLYEHKEIILIHFQRPLLQELLGVVNGPYTFENFYDMPNDPSPLIQTLFNPEIWGENNVPMKYATSNSSINMAAITDADIENLKLYRDAATVAISNQPGGSNITYNFVHLEVDKLDFIKILRDKGEITVDDIDTIIGYEISNQYHSGGSFYAIDVSSVNTYFVDYLLMNSENPSALSPYALTLP